MQNKTAHQRAALKWYNKNKKRCQVSKRKYYESHMTEKRAQSAKWRKDHPGAYAGKYRYKGENIDWLLKHLHIEKISCLRCGYNVYGGAIDGHHLYPERKKGARDSLRVWMYLAPKKFQEKFLSNQIVFLCRNCHSELHANIWNIGEIINVK